jgi:hypothetical protein
VRSRVILCHSEVPGTRLTRTKISLIEPSDMSGFIVFVDEPGVTSVQKHIDSHSSLPGASVDPTEASKLS